MTVNWINRSSVPKWWWMRSHFGLCWQPSFRSRHLGWEPPGARPADRSQWEQAARCQILLSHFLNHQWNDFSLSNGRRQSIRGKTAQRKANLAPYHPGAWPRPASARPDLPCYSLWCFQFPARNPPGRCCLQRPANWSGWTQGVVGIHWRASC